MARGRPLSPLTLTSMVREELGRIAGSRTLPYGLVRRSRIVLLSAEGMSNKTVAARVGVSTVTVGMWRQRFLQQGLMVRMMSHGPARVRSPTSRWLS